MSLWSNAASTWSSNAGGVSTTTKSNCCLSRSSSFGDQGGGDRLGGARLDRRDQRRQARASAASAATRPPDASRLSTSGHRVGDGVGGEQLQRDGDVAEGEVEVDEADLAAAAVGQRGREVGGERGLAAAALGREDRDQLAAWCRGRSAGGRAPTVSRSCRASSRARRTAALRPARSRSSTTSKTPARSASVSTDGVDAAADQDDGQARPGHPHRLGERQGGAEVDAWGRGRRCPRRTASRGGGAARPGTAGPGCPGRALRAASRRWPGRGRRWRSCQSNRFVGGGAGLAAGRPRASLPSRPRYSSPVLARRRASAVLGLVDSERQQGLGHCSSSAGRPTGVATCVVVLPAAMHRGPRSAGPGCRPAAALRRRHGEEDATLEPAPTKPATRAGSSSWTLTASWPSGIGSGLRLAGVAELAARGSARRRRSARARPARRCGVIVTEGAR